MTSARRLLSLVVPVYDEAENLLVLRERLASTLESLAARGFEHEIVFVDDASTDATPEILKELAADPRVKVIRFVRNFGSQAALMAGLAATKGDCAVLLAADLQEPPELLPRLLDAWEEGYRLVIAARENTTGAIAERLLSRLFYAAMNRISQVRFPDRGADAFLLDRRVIRDLLALGERNLSIFGLILWLGHRAKVVPYRREERLRGVSGWTFYKRVKIFIDAVIGFSYVPFRLFSGAGLAILAASAVYLGVLVVNRVFFWDESALSGWTSLMAALLVLNGFVILGLGILGEYVWRILDEVRGRPLYLVERTLNLEEPALRPGAASAAEPVRRA
jgi:dolichol-phosphate mannosyltransferase